MRAYEIVDFICPECGSHLDVRRNAYGVAVPGSPCWLRHESADVAPYAIVHVLGRPGLIVDWRQ